MISRRVCTGLSALAPAMQRALHAWRSSNCHAAAPQNGGNHLAVQALLGRRLVRPARQHR
jgi:hypothetical protein